MTGHPVRLLTFVLVAGLILACGSRTPDQGQQTPQPDPRPASAGTVTSEEPARRHANSLEQLLAGRIAGVTVSRARGGGISVRMMGGPTSFYSNQEPLYVLDGIPVSPGAGGTFNWLNPEDIESIEAIKDPSRTALYGVRGGNGVIVIKTKGSH